MNKVLLLIAFGVLSLLSISEVFSQEEQEAEAIQNLVQKAHAVFDFSGAVLVAKEGKVIAVAAVGTTEGRKPKPIDANTLFEIGSCTKPFTAVAIMQLVEQGKIGLDDSIADYLPRVPANCQAITVRHLLQHTSGIPGTNSKGHGTRLDRVLPVFLAGGPKHIPGTNHEYWNQGYSLLSEIIARASGKKYTVYSRTKIFKPCGMSNTKFTGDSVAKGVKVATGLSSYGKPRSALEHPYGEYGFQYRGMGGIVTSVNDLWKWEQALQSGKMLSEESMSSMADPGEFNYGLGWAIARNKKGELVQKHSGSVRGFVSAIRRYPKRKGCIFVLTNRDNGLPMNLVADGCEKIFNGETIDLEFPSQLDEAILNSVDGSYVDSKNRKMIVASSAGITTATIYWGGPVTNGFLGQDQNGTTNFYMLESSSPLKFKIDSTIEVGEDKNGNVKSVTLIGVGPKLTFNREQ
jgi:CubicO group peptidase (beta-lactamase class C family)